MNYKDIFRSGAKKTSIGGQAIMEGVYLRSQECQALAVRLPDDTIHTEYTMLGEPGAVTKVPLVRGVVSFFLSLYQGMKTLTRSADVLEEAEEREERDERNEDAYDESGFSPEEGDSSKKEKKEQRENALWNLMMLCTVLLSLALSIAIFVILPTVIVGFLRSVIASNLVLNLIEGSLRILIFVLYVVGISFMKDIYRLFQYHGAEHKTIHCFEAGLELTPENAQRFSTLHPRCGTSFIMFVFIISLLLFSFLGWPNLAWRILSRILLLPVIAGISYELLRWAGRSDGAFIRVMSWPGLMMQRLTTREPDDEQLEVAIAALHEVLAHTDLSKDGTEYEKRRRRVKRASAVEDEEPREKENIPAAESSDDETSFAWSADGAASAAGLDPALAAEAAHAYAEAEHAARKAGFPYIEDDFENPFGVREEAAALERELAQAEERPVPHAAKEARFADFPRSRYEEDITLAKNCVRAGIRRLDEAGIPNAKGEARDIFCYEMGFSHTEIITRADELLPVDRVREYFALIQKRADGTPLQYITKVQEFMGLLFRLDENVLIPRQDTEILADETIHWIKSQGIWDPRVLDLCTGSGILGITMAYTFPCAEVVMTDISPKALEVAAKNTQFNETSDRCTLKQGNYFRALEPDETFDVIISNPPYIASDEILRLTKDVRDHEPRLALDGGEDGLNAYRIIAMDAGQHLRKGGLLALEIGYDQGASVPLLLERSGDFENIRVLRDLRQRDRVVLAERK